MRRKTHARRTADIKPRAKGGYAYEGTWERLGERTPRSRVMPRLAGCLAVAALATVVPGLLPVDGLRGTLNVVLTYAAQLVSVVCVAWTCVRLLRAGEPMRAYVREETAGRLPGRALVGAFFAAATALGDAVRLVVEGIAPDAFELVFIACGMVASVALGSLWHLARSLVWERVEAPDQTGE